MECLNVGPNPLRSTSASRFLSGHSVQGEVEKKSEQSLPKMLQLPRRVPLGLARKIFILLKPLSRKKHELLGGKGP